MAPFRGCSGTRCSTGHCNACKGFGSQTPHRENAATHQSADWHVLAVQDLVPLALATWPGLLLAPGQPSGCQSVCPRQQQGATMALPIKQTGCPGLSGSCSLSTSGGSSSPLQQRRAAEHSGPSAAYAAIRPRWGSSCPAALGLRPALSLHLQPPTSATNHDACVCARRLQR